MAATHKGAISFGLVHIPIALHTATQDNDIRFNQLCKEDGSRVKYKKVCANCGKEVTNADIVKGFEYEDGKYVTMTDADFEKAKTAKDRTVQILHFAELSDIPPIYFDKTYHAVPETGGDKAYELLRRAMYEEKKVALAKTLIESMVKPFEPAQYHDEYQARLKQIIEDKIAGKEIVEAPKERTDNVIDLMAALEASLQQIQNAKPKKRTTRKKATSA